ncbi:MAG: response regulator [Nitrospinae bacterium]|nr:response regulator [Nitrospinota bacterium]
MARILVIDDDESTRAIIAHKLGKTHEAFAVRGGHEALTHLEKEKVDLILIDQMMPHMNGLEAYTLFRERLAECPPAVMMTAFSNTELAVAFMKAGGADFVLKPLDFEILEIKVKNALRLGALNAAPQRQISEADLFFAAASDGFCSIEFDGAIRIANRAMEDMLLFPRGELKGKNFHNVILPADQETVIAELEHLQRDSGHPTRIESRVNCYDGSVKTISWSATIFEKRKLIFLTAREVGEGFLLQHPQARLAI